jgi:hypothetical protein
MIFRIRSARSIVKNIAIKMKNSGTENVILPLLMALAIT